MKKIILGAAVLLSVVGRAEIVSEDNRWITIGRSEPVIWEIARKNGELQLRKAGETPAFLRIFAGVEYSEPRRYFLSSTSDYGIRMCGQAPRLWSWKNRLPCAGGRWMEYETNIELTAFGALSVRYRPGNLPPPEAFRGKPPHHYLMFRYNDQKCGPEHFTINGKGHRLDAENKSVAVVAEAPEIVFFPRQGHLETTLFFQGKWYIYGWYRNGKGDLRANPVDPSAFIGFSATHK